MPLVDATLQAALSAKYFAQIKLKFPSSGANQPAIEAQQQNLADALAEAASDIDNQIKTATVAVTGVTAGGATAPGTLT